MCACVRGCTDPIDPAAMAAALRLSTSGSQPDGADGCAAAVALVDAACCSAFLRSSLLLAWARLRAAAPLHWTVAEGVALLLAATAVSESRPMLPLLLLLLCELMLRWSGGKGGCWCVGPRSSVGSSCVAAVRLWAHWAVSPTRTDVSAVAAVWCSILNVRVRVICLCVCCWPLAVCVCVRLDGLAAVS